MKRFPNSSNNYDSYVEYFETVGNLKTAKKYYEKAINVEEKNDNYFFQKQIFIDNLKRVNKKLN